MIDNPLYRFAFYFLIMPALGILMIRSWIKEYKKLKAFRKNSVVVSGKIIKVSKEKDSDGATIYFPIVEFKYNDKATTFKSGLGDSNGRQVYEEVKVAFNADHPENAEINEFMPKYFGIIMISIFILVLISSYFIDFIFNVK